MLNEQKLRILDFDDTLVKSKSNIYVRNNQTGKSFTLTPGEYAVYDPKPGDEFDYSEFSKLISPTAIKKYNDLLKRFLKASGNRKIVILTARGSIKPIGQYLKSIGITSGVQMVGLANSDPMAKQRYVEKMIKAGYKDVFFIDDSVKNVKAISKLKSRYPNVKIDARVAKPN